AYKESFNHFKEIFEIENNDIINLDLTYRSPNNVLKISHDLIKQNYENLDECVLIKNAHGIDGEKVDVVELLNASEEARFISEKVDEAIKKGTPMNEICILCRTHNQSEIIKQALDSKNISHISAGKINLMQKREVKIAISYLGILSNLIERSGTGDQSWWELFHFQNTLSMEDSVKIGRYLKDHRKKNIGIDEALLNSLDELSLSEKSKEIIQRVVKKLRELVISSTKPLPELILDVFEISGLNRAFSHERSIKNIESLMNLKKFYEVAENYYEMHEKSLPEFIKYLEIIDTLKVNVEASKIIHIDAVRVMTIHSAKGLEFDLVISTNLAKDRFPLVRTKNEPLIPKHLIPDLIRNIPDWDSLDEKEREKKVKDYEKNTLLIEERRLCYIAWTRAKKELIITYALSYNNEPNSTIHSQFLYDIDYANNESCNYIIDEGDGSSVIAKSSDYEKHKSLLKEQLVKSLDIDDYKAIIQRCIDYVACRDNNVEFDLNSIKIDKNELAKQLKKDDTKQPLLIFNPKTFTFSPSSLMTYSECPKKFELQHLYQMPQRGSFDSKGSGANFGSFVHLVCEDGVNEGFNTLDQYINLAKEKVKEDEWEGVDIEKVIETLNVFWERNHFKINKDSKTEKELNLEIDGFRFFGIADRIDKLPDETIEIVDYKTNKSPIESYKREIQLGFYALALEQMGYKVSKVTLDMLKLDKPVEFGLNNGEFKSLNGKEKSFKLEEVKEEIIKLANLIKEDYEKGFAVAKDDKPCHFCGYKFYCPKWEE
ncbi:ATP-dependent helicase, partial [Candidatus Woesearchaeota archaeon]|nr:ATP-dependent helicase [Candidatus Woesearchaeota archaeon]